MEKTKRFSVALYKYLYDFDSFVELLTDGRFGFMPPDSMGKVGAYAFYRLNKEGQDALLGAAAMADTAVNTLDERILSKDDYARASTFDRIETEVIADSLQELALNMVLKLQDMIWSCADNDENYEPPDILSISDAEENGEEDDCEDEETEPSDESI